MEELTINNVTAGYNDIPVIHDVNIEVHSGEIVALIGPSGAGKSTVLKAVFNLADVVSGRVYFGNKEITKMPTYGLLETGIAFVPQGRLVFGSLTVRENLEMGAYLVDHKEVKQKSLDAVFNYFPALREKQMELAANLSGGQQQMLALGRALMMTPQCLLLDEPSLGLAPKVIKEVFSKVKEVNKGGTSIVIVEQNVHAALEIAHRVYVLANGRVVAHGPAQEFHNLEKLKKLFFQQP